MPEINRFRRGDSFEKMRANEWSVEAVLALVAVGMDSCKEGSRIEEIWATEKWQGEGVVRRRGL